ncbi:TOX high mobility group box family member 2 isoform X4 [Gopherus evgoodei]|uniref:TOX high mobility group box family member 2 isoform X4 n=1 Tax=Gopherus evgoodei TaxID=1825980 RepID=UPI0011CF8D5E|nr:TOX high mobility group box family member 2 isoform X4 [Gopherus evgoodei]XP_032649231.1 TOX high mobility group box family member 2 isoform X4 [Chelonoidis abingdonii]XP_039355193.1 TOX high mobility group box family member 2 isoform X6 [Mauremys reevesii]
MDVRFYPSAPSAVASLPGAEPGCLGPLDYYHCNKFDGENMYMGMNDNNQEFLSANQTYNGQNENNEDYEIPPITPPNLPEPSLLHLVDHETGYHSLCHGLPPNSLIPAYSYQNMDLPAIMVSNMLSQDGHLLSSQLPTVSGEKRPSTDLGKKPKSQKKKKKKDPNEPQKPVSAYALFFRDTQAAIKGQNPNATFGDVSKIVASMWDSLGEEQKQAYKRKTEAAKKEYLKALAAYRASLVSKSSADQGETKSAQPNQPSKMIPPKQPMYTMPPQASSPYPGLGSFLSPSDLQSYRGHPHPSLSRTLSSKPMLPSISASPPPSFQISPPLHQQLSLHHPQSSLLNQSLSMQQVPQQSILSPSMALQVQPPMNASPPGQQDFSHISSEFQNSVGPRSPGASNPPGNTDWDNDYSSRECGINHCSMLPRDKSLYLT